MKKSLIMVSLGAGLMYLLDPELGEVRRSMLKDKFAGLLPQTNDALSSKVSEVAAKANEITEKADHVAAETIQALGQEELGHADSSASGNGAAPPNA